MADLKTNFVNDALNTSVNTKRKYNMETNADGTISLTDATSYDVVGDTFGAVEINATNAAVNANTTAISNKMDSNKIVILDSDIGEGTAVEYADGTLIFCKG